MQDTAPPGPKHISAVAATLKRIVQFIKDYWILGTVLLAVLGALGSVCALRERAEVTRQADYHVQVGRQLLDRGHYREAKSSFEAALELRDANRLAAQGALLCDMHTDQDSSTWVPSVGWVGVSQLESQGLHGALKHVAQKFKGDLRIAMGYDSIGLAFYRRAIERKPDYVDGLLRCGWHWYGRQGTRVCVEPESMLIYFRRASEVDSFNERVAHAMGTGLYVLAAEQKDYTKRRALLDSAVDYCKRAANLHPNLLVTVLDLGEVLRATYPDTALFYHRELVDRIYADSTLLNLRGNKSGFQVPTIMRRTPQVVDFRDAAELRVLIDFYLSLDYLAGFWKWDVQSYEDSSISCYLRAVLADVRNNASLVYRDQRQALGVFFPPLFWQDFGKAVEHYSQRIREDPACAELYCFRGLAYGEIELYDSAHADYCHAIELDPAYGAAYHNRAGVYLEKGQYNSAVADYSGAIALDSLDPVSYICRGDAYSKLNLDSLAFVDYNRAIELDTLSATACNSRGNAYYELDLDSLAVVDYSRAIEQNPEDPVYYSNRGNAYYKLDLDSLAVVDYSSAIELNSKDTGCYNSRGNAYCRLDLDSLAVVDYSSAIELNSKDPVYYRNRGNAYDNLGLDSLAIEDFGRAVELDSAYVSAWNERGVVYYELGLYRLAIDDFSRAIELDPEDPVYYSNRGGAYHDLDLDSLAIADYGQALKCGTEDSAGCYSARALAYEAIGDTWHAAADFLRAAAFEQDE